MNRTARTVVVAVGVAAVAVAITVWSTRTQGVAETGLRPVVASSFEGRSPWGFDSTTGSVTTTTRWSHTGRRSLLATATAGVPAYVSANLPATTAIWGRFWLRVQHRPDSGATVVMAVTGTHAGMFLKLQADGRLALVALGGTVIGRSAAAAGVRPAVPDRLGMATLAGARDRIDRYCAGTVRGSSDGRSGSHVEARRRRSSGQPSRRRDR